MKPLKKTLIRSFSALLSPACRAITRSECVVLTYHGVVPSGSDPSVDQEQKFVLEADFIRQLEFLGRNYRPVSLAEFEKSVVEGTPLPPRSVLVTIDDGYENVFTSMAPHFARAGIPAALYVTTGFIDGGTTLWTNRVEMWWSEVKRRGETGAVAKRPTTLAGVKKHLKSLPESEREKELDRWIGDTGRSLPAGHVFRMMTWDQTRRIESSGVAIGSHTVTHQILAHESDESARREIVESRRKLEEELGHPVTTFAYPNGGPGFFLPRDEKLLAETGYQVGLSMIRGRHRTGDNPFAIRRIAVGREEGWVELLAARMAFPYGLKDRFRGGSPRPGNGM